MISQPLAVMIEKLSNGRYQWLLPMKRRSRALLVGQFTYKTSASARRAARRAFAMLWPDVTP